MKNKKKDNKRENKGITLIEVMAVIAILGILASIVYVSLSSATRNSQAASVLRSMTSTAPLIYKCLTKSTTTMPTTIGIMGSANICIGYAGFPGWPDIDKTGWSYGNSFWCDVTSVGVNPPASCGDYIDGSCGGDRTNKKFCYGIKDVAGEKFIWCTDQGCQKSGF